MKSKHTSVPLIVPAISFKEKKIDHMEEANPTGHTFDTITSIGVNAN